MTIAIVHEVFFPTTNGVLTSTIAMARELQRRGHRVVFIAPAWKAFRGMEVEGIPVEYVPSIPSGIYPGVRLTWPGAGRVLRVLQRRGVNVVHLTAQGTLSWSCLRAARRLGLPVVSTLHTLIFEPEYLRYALRMPQRAGWALVRCFLQHSDIVTAPSRYVCRLIEAKCPGVRPVHISNCVAGEFFGVRRGAETAPGANEEKWGSDRDPELVRFVYVGRLGQEKSIEVLLEGFLRAWRRDRRLRLTVVGDGPQAQEYRRQAVQNATAGRNGPVQFTGQLSQQLLLRSGVMQSARALVTASTTENQPVSVLEAISLGRPVIVPDVEGIKELVDGNGSRFAAGDADALARELLRMAWDEEFFEGCAARARELGGRYTAGRVAQEFERVYAQATAGKTAEGTAETEAAGSTTAWWWSVLDKNHVINHD